jgi:hypothetical protein
MSTKKLLEVRKEAEKAVADMADGDLKLKAFEVILSHLLGTPEGTGKGPAKTSSDAAATPAKQAAKARTAAARILVLRNEGFFKNQRPMGEISDELAAHGWHYALTSLSGTLIALAQRQELRRVRSKKGNKKVWLYSEP